MKFAKNKFSTFVSYSSDFSAEYFSIKCDAVEANSLQAPSPPRHFLAFEYSVFSIIGNEIIFQTIG